MKLDLSALFFLPSFYASATWLVALTLYHWRLMDWFPTSTEAVVAYWATAAVFVLATVLHWPSSQRLLGQLRTCRSLDGRFDVHMLYAAPSWALAGLHLLGFTGLALYLSEITGRFGGLEGLTAVLLSESYLIRQSEIDLVSIYISYFGWIAVPLSVLRMRATRRISLPLATMTALQFAGNLLFLDRTRPVWLVFMSVIILLPLLDDISFRSIAKRLLALVMLGLFAFFSIGIWLGKTGEAFAYYGDVRVDHHFAALYYYLTGGFAYMSAQIEAGPPASFGLEQSLYPLYKLGTMIGVNDSPPSQVLPFIDLPFPANVGTFLEPYFMDGGYALMILAVVVHAFGLNAAALALLRSFSAWGWFLWSNLCFIGFIAFFVPKLVSTPVWMFFAIGIPLLVLRFLRRRMRAASRKESLQPGNSANHACER
jgi:hypothetical protein